MLENVTREDQPVLGRIDGDRWGVITLCLNHDAIAVRRINLSLVGGKLKFATEWVKYNEWLHGWYLEQSLGSIAGNTNEHKTQLRAGGYGEEKVEKTIEGLRVDRLRYEEHKKAATRKGVIA